MATVYLYPLGSLDSEERPSFKRKACSLEEMTATFFLTTKGFSSGMWVGVSNEYTNYSGGFLLITFKSEQGSSKNSRWLRRQILQSVSCCFFVLLKKLLW